MRESVILSFFIWIGHKLSAYYKNSMLCWLIDKISDGFRRMFTNSRIISFFTGKDLAEKKLSRSLIQRICDAVTHFFEWAHKGLSPVSERIQNSFICDVYLETTRHFKYINLQKYGVIILNISVFFTLSALIRDMGRTSMVVGIAGSIVGAVLLLIRKSPMELLGRSLFAALFEKVFDILPAKYDENGYDNLSRKSIILFCILSAVLILAFHPVVAVFCLAAVYGVFLLIVFPLAGVLLAVLMAPIVPTMLLIGFVCLSLVTFLLHILFVKPVKIKVEGLGLCILGYIFIIVISSVFSVTPKESIYAGAVWSVFLLYFFVMYHVVERKDQLKTLLHVFVFSGVVVSLIGLLQWKFGDSMAASWIDKEMFEDVSTRIYSTLGNPNTLGQFLVLVLPVSVAMLFTQKDWLSKFYYLCATGVMVLALALTYSRGCYLAAMLSIFVMIVILKPKCIWLFFLGAILAMFVLPDSIINRFASIGNLNDSSTSFRVYVWIGTIELLKVFWPCGIGLGIDSYSKIYPYFAYPGVLVNHAHNVYLQTAADFGIMGIIICIVLFISYFRNGFSSYKKIGNKADKVLIISLVAAMVGILAEGMFDYIFYNYRVFFLFAASLGFMGIYKKLTAQELITEEAYHGSKEE